MPVAPDDPRRVDNDGDPTARIVILGGAPNREEDEKNKPLIGWAGNKLFNDFLFRANITRDQCLIGNVIPVKPPNNKIHQLYSIGVDLHEEMEATRNWINAHPRDLVICLGNTALECLTGQRNISLYRGSLLTNPGGAPTPHHEHPYDIFVMNHPSSIAMDWQLDAICKVDAKKLRKIRAEPPGEYNTPLKHLYMYGQEVQRDLRSRVTIPTEKSAGYFLNFIHQVQQSTEPFAFDIETYNETITVFGLATSATRAISIPFTGQFSEFEEATLIEAIRDLLDSPVPKITQNGIYDCTLLADQWRVSVRGAVYDTMLMHHCLYSELPHSLAFLTSVYSSEPFFKQMAKEADHDSYDLAHWEYNALDCACTYESWEAMKAELTHFKLWDFYLTHYVPLSRTIANVQRRGLLLDKDLRQKVKKDLEVELIALRDQLNTIVGHEFNVNSPKQMKEYVHGVLKLPQQRNRATGKSSLGQTQIATLQRRYPSHVQFFKCITNIRAKKKLISTYLKPLEDPDGRVRTSYNIAGSAHKADSSGGTETGRLSSSTNCYRRGGNLQNIPKSIREMFIAEPGWSFWQCDMSSAESYVVAWESSDEVMLEVLTNHSLFGKGRPEKIMYHETIGQIITGLEPEEVVGDIRALAKSVGHAWNYGMAEKKLVELVNNFMPQMTFSAQDAVTCYRNLNNTLRAVINWRTMKRQKILKDRTLMNCFGRKRIFFGRLDDNTFREAYAFIPQGTVGDALNKFMIQLEDQWEGRDDVKILGQVHDSVMGVCANSELTNVQAQVEHVFTQELPMTCRGIPLKIPCEFNHGANWKECG